MGSLGAMLKHPEDVYPLLKLRLAAKNAEKQIPPQPHWAFCFTMLHKVSRSFALVTDSFALTATATTSYGLVNGWRSVSQTPHAVRPVAEDEMFRVIRTGKRKSKFQCFISAVTCNI
ncbi:hypothetical protein Syun_006444 [Stephania yunnanensis]|uniref:Uncharacterized protein n=1 Tax=Stephania yunnanensis TaxID=152371 RepID=A0AAP0PXK1_9MAGN